MEERGFDDEDARGRAQKNTGAPVFVLGDTPFRGVGMENVLRMTSERC